ncbi:MAG: hypothetical protein M1830_006403, partial [Pleopsidium flavum]
MPQKHPPTYYNVHTRPSPPHLPPLSTPFLPSSPLKNTRINTNNDDQTNHNQRGRDQRHKRHTAPTSREFAADDPMLAFEIAVEADEEDDDGDAEESGAEGFADLAEAGGVLSGGDGGGGKG